MSLYKLDFKVGTNEDWCDTIRLTTPGDNPQPYPITSAWQIKQHLRLPIEALHTVLDLSLANEKLALLIEEDTAGPAEVILAWNVPKAIMQTIEPGEYPHDVVFIDPDGGVMRFAEGTVTVVRGITRWL